MRKVGIFWIGVDWSESQAAIKGIASKQLSDFIVLSYTFYSEFQLTEFESGCYK